MKKVEPRKQANQDRAKFTVDSIIEATTLLLKEKGLKKLTTNKIVDKAGVSIGSLYQYFPGKEAILAIVMERQFKKDLAKFKVKLDSLTPEEFTLKEAVHEAVVFFMKDFSAQSSVYKELMFSILTIKSLKFTLKHDQLMEEYLADFIKRFKKEVREDLDLAFFTFFIQYTVKGLKLGMTFSNKDNLVDKTIEQLTVIIYGHVKKHD
ncbi:TetR/AcrR family transcriptional regulator [Bacteriovoracaceae bacterium]|nr:TetR/AcrR family transcriptional regulator [Bacteriovoracaceae bacterium]